MAEIAAPAATMRAAVFRGAEGLAVEDAPRPEAGPGEIRVRVAACGLCHTDLHYLDHGVPTFKAPPLVLGHECSGTVDAVGPGVEGFAPGDRVLLPAVLTCGRYEMCRRGHENVCAHMRMFGNHVDGAYAEWVTAPARDAFHLPPEIPLEEGCIIADALTTPYHAVVRRGRVAAGDRVAVIGCGGIGLGLVQFALAQGARVVAVDLSEAKLDLARKLGAEATLDPLTLEEPARALRRALGAAPDVVFEAIGNPDTLALAVDVAPTGGRVVVVGYCDRRAPLQAGKIMFRELDVVGSLGCRPVDYPRVIDMVRRGAVRLEPMVSHRFPLEEIARGLDMLRAGELIRGIVVP